MDTDDGGPAFPILRDNWEPHYGMSLRDYFAAKAAQGMLADPKVNAPSHQADKFCKDVAEAAYKMADALLAASKHRSSQ